MKQISERKRLIILTIVIILSLAIFLALIYVKEKRCEEKYYVWKIIIANFGEMQVKTGEWIEITSEQYVLFSNSYPQYRNYIKKECN